MGDEEPQQSQQGVMPQVLGQLAPIDDGTMDDIVDKLKLLNYDQDFLPTGKPAFKPLSRSYFAQPDANPNAQFFYFTSLVSWLMLQSRHNGFPPPGQFDDPNATATNIITELRSMGLSVANLAPNRIRQGHGEAVLSILSLLVDKALLTRGFAFAPVEYLMQRAEEGLDTAEAPGSAAGGHESDIDDKIDVGSDSDEEVYVHQLHGKRSGDEEGTEMIVSQVSAETWALEVERVGPQLQVRQDDIRDWRARIEGASVLLKAAEKMYPEVKQMLERMGDDLQKGRERIEKREQTLSKQFAEHVESYSAKLRDLNSAQDSFTQASQNVSQLSVELNQVSEQLDKTKVEIEEREARISDTTPLIKIKEAVTKVRTEIKQMSLRIGVLQHTVLHHTLKQSKAKREKQEAGYGAEVDLGNDQSEGSFVL